MESQPTKPLYVEHPVFEPPADQAVLWRYMTFAKYVSLLSKQALYCCRADSLQDTYEGMLPKPTFDILAEWLRESYLALRTQTAVNCWSELPYESMALWRAYVPHGEGVTVRTTFDRLCSSFERRGIWVQGFVYVGRIKYVDFNQHDFLGPERTAFNAFIPLVHKRQYFEFEHEVRVLVGTGGNQLFDQFVARMPGVYLPVDITKLVEQVVVAPNSPEWFLEAVADCTAAFGLPSELVVPSAIDSPAAGGTPVR